MLTHIDYPSLPDADAELTKDYAARSAREILSDIRANIKLLSAKGMFKSGLYSYLLDLIEEDAMTDNDVKHPSQYNKSANSYSFAFPRLWTTF